MRIILFLLVLSSLPGCPVTSKKTDELMTAYPDPCESFGLTRKMWKFMGLQAKDQIMGCLNPAYLYDGGDGSVEISPLKAIARGIVMRLLICPQAPVMPVVSGLFQLIATPIIYIPIDLFSPKPESCNDKTATEHH